MSRSPNERISDIRNAIQRCRTFAPYTESNNTTISEMANFAIERNLEIIGEAAKHLPDSITLRYPQVEWNEIRGFRNILAHEYFGIDAAIIRTILATRLSQLDGVLAEHQASYPMS